MKKGIKQAVVKTETDVVTCTRRILTRTGIPIAEGDDGWLLLLLQMLLLLLLLLLLLSVQGSLASFSQRPGARALA